MSWGPDPWARRLAGSPHLTSPLSRSFPPGTDRWEFHGTGRVAREIRRQEPKEAGARPRDQGQGDYGPRGLYHNNRFLGDHIPGGGIDLRASGCAPCVCLPLTLLYSYSPMDRPTSSHELILFFVRVGIFLFRQFLALI